MTKRPEEYTAMLDELEKLFSNPEAQAAIDELKEAMANNNPIVDNGKLRYKGYYATVKVNLDWMNIQITINENDDIDFSFNAETVEEASKLFKEVVDNYFDSQKRKRLTKAKEIIADVEEQTKYNPKTLVYKGFTCTRKYHKFTQSYYGKVDAPWSGMIRTETAEGFYKAFKMTIDCYLSGGDSPHPGVMC